MHVPAAGGVLRRLRPDGEAEIAVIHRPKYDDWSLPKGKLEPGETFEEAAVREVEEETGVRAALGRELGEARYKDRRGRPKFVRYWLMTPISGRFLPDREVDEIRWLTPAEAGELPRYDFARDPVGRPGGPLPAAGGRGAGARAAGAGGRAPPRGGPPPHPPR